VEILVRIKTNIEEAQCPLLHICKKVFEPRPCDINEWRGYESVLYSNHAPCLCTPALEYNDGDEGEGFLGLLKTDFKKTHQYEEVL